MDLDSERLREIRSRYVQRISKMDAYIECLERALEQIASVPVASPPDPVAMSQMRQIASNALAEKR